MARGNSRVLLLSFLPLLRREDTNSTTRSCLSIGVAEELCSIAAVYLDYPGICPSKTSGCTRRRSSLEWSDYRLEIQL